MARFVRVSVFLAFLGFSATAHAALTPAQIREHIGAMLQYGAANFLNGNEQVFRDLRLKDLAKWAAAYRINGALGTLADRTEAMKAFQRNIFTAATGKDPVAQQHFYKNHFLDELAPGEANVLEP